MPKAKPKTQTKKGAMMDNPMMPGGKHMMPNMPPKGMGPGMMDQVKSKAKKKAKKGGKK